MLTDIDGYQKNRISTHFKIVIKINHTIYSKRFGRGYQGI